MNFKDLLNTDLKVVGRQLRAAFVWWVRELASLAPASQGAARSRDGVRAEVLADGAFRLTRDGATLGIVGQPGETSRAVTLVLAPKDVLTRRLELPLLPPSDTRRMLALDLDRLTPFRSDQVFFDAEVLERREDIGRQTVLLGVAPREQLTAVVERAQRFGLTPRAVTLAADANAPTHLDLLGAMSAGGAASAMQRRLAYWWGAVAVLMIVNLASLVVRDSLDVQRMQGLVQSQRTTAGVALHLRQRVVDEALARAALAQRQGRSEPLRVLDTVTRALPRGAWVQRLEYNGRSVHLIGYKPASFDVVGALKASPALINVRSVAADPPAGVTSDQPFDVTADVRGAG